MVQSFSFQCFFFLLIDLLSMHKDCTMKVSCPEIRILARRVFGSRGPGFS